MEKFALKFLGRNQGTNTRKTFNIGINFLLIIIIGVCLLILLIYIRESVISNLTQNKFRKQFDTDKATVSSNF